MPPRYCGGIPAPGGFLSLRTLSFLALGLPLLACVGPLDSADPGGNSSTDEDSGGEISITAPDEVVLNDTTDGLEITITGGSATGWLFGVIGPSESDTEEGCHDGGDVCHTLDATGGTLDWCQDAEDGCTSVAQLYYREGIESYVLKPTLGLGCWSWGDAAGYYDDLGCTEMSWETSSYH